MLEGWIDDLRTLLVGRVVEVDAVPVVMEADGSGGEKAKVLEGLLTRPKRPRGSTLTGSHLGFTDLVFDLDSVPYSRVYYDIYGSLRAVLNDDYASAGAGWKDWTVDYAPVLDEAWEKWTGFDGRWYPQLETAEFIQERVADFVFPSGADMLELAQQFDVTRSGSFSSGVRLDSGMTRLTVEETATGRSSIDIPNVVNLAMRVFDDMDAYSFKVLFRWRIRDGKLLMSFKIVDRQLIMRTAVNDMVALVKTALPNHKFFKVKALPVPVPSLRTS